MALPENALSLAAKALRKLLFDGIADVAEADVFIGHPKWAIEKVSSDKQNINIFFYHVSIDGYPADGASNQPFYIRMYCLITPFGLDSGSGSVSLGENDLRLVGEVMAVLHKTPMLKINNGGGNEALLEIVPAAMQLENLNHIWSTQGDTAYRLSVAYELSLAPVPFAAPSEVSPLVGSPDMLVWGDMSRDSDNENNGMINLTPAVSYLEIDTAADDWIPHICFKGADNTLHYVAEVTDTASELEVLVAAKEGENVTFFWNVWRRQDDNVVVAWEEGIDDTVMPLEKRISNTTPGEVFHANRIDPGDIDARRIFTAKLPTEVKVSESKSWQAILYAVNTREVEYPQGSGIKINKSFKSNPLMFYGSKS